MLALTLALSLQLGAGEARPEAWVVVSRRSGVTKPQALEYARTIVAGLTERSVPTPLAPEDAAQCNAKVPCLVDLASAKGVSVIITVEAGSALDDLVLHVEALSVEEFGKKLSTFDFSGAPKDLKTGLSDKLEEFFAPAVRGALGVGKPVATAKPEPVKPAPEPVKPAPEPVKPKPDEPVATKPAEPAPTPSPVVVEEKASGGFGPMKIAGIGAMAAGAVALIISGGIGVNTLGLAGQQSALCPAGMPCTNPKAYTLYNSAGGSQTAGLVTMAIGLVLVAAGATLFFVF